MPSWLNAKQGAKKPLVPEAALNPYDLHHLIELAEKSRGNRPGEPPNAFLLFEGESKQAEGYAEADRNVFEQLQEAKLTGRHLELFLAPTAGQAQQLFARGLEKISFVESLQDSFEGCQKIDEPYSSEGSKKVLRSYLHRNASQRPWIVLKAATSLDGRIATRTGHSQWITGPEARERGYLIRHQSDAILVGVGTVLADNPSLTARIEGGQNPIRVVLDSSLRTPLDSHLVKSAQQIPTWIFADRDSCPEQKRAAFQKQGVRVLEVYSGVGGLDLLEIVSSLRKEGVRQLMVEGGAQVHGAFVDAGLVDEVAWFLAPKLIGGLQAPSALAGQGIAQLEEALLLEAFEIENLGPDLLLSALVQGRLD